MAPSNPNQKPLGSQGSKPRSNAPNVDNTFANVDTNSSTPTTRPAAPSNRIIPPPSPNMPNPPRSTVERSRFFPGGRPTPGLVLRGYNPAQAQSTAQAAEQTPSSQQGSNHRGQDTATNEDRPSEFTPTNPRNASQPQRAARRDELEQKAPTAEAQKRLQPTRPGDTWVTGLQSWRRGGAPQQRPPQGFDAKASSSFLRNDLRRSTLSPFAPAFRSYAPRPMATAPAVVTAAPALPLRLPLPLPRAPPRAPAPAPPTGAYPRARGSRHTAGQCQQNQGFRPMNSKLNPEAKNRPLTKEEVEYRKANGISPNYRGEATNPQNISADIPDHENCSLWLTNLPPHCTYRDLLAAVARHQPGRIYATSISPPDEDSDHTLPSHRTSAAKMAFYRPEEATRLLQLCSMGLLKVQGYRVRAVRNRVKVPATVGKDDTSRCLVIWGPRALVNEIQLTRLFNEFFTFDTDEVILRHEGENVRCLEWRFGSFRSQADSAAKMLADKEHKDFYSVKFARDPCERTFG